MFKVNPDILKPMGVHDNHMNVLITGGKDKDRAVLQDVIFNALEGAGFRDLEYVPQGYRDVPPVEVKTMLDSMHEQNPDFFERKVSIETASRIWAEPDIEPVNEQAWERITTRTSPNSKISMEVCDGTLRIHF